MRFKSQAQRRAVMRKVYLLAIKYPKYKNQKAKTEVYAYKTKEDRDEVIAGAKRTVPKVKWAKSEKVLYRRG